MPRKSKAERIADERINHAYTRYCSGIRINVMDIGKVFGVGRAAIAAGANDQELAIKIVDFVHTIRV